MNPLIRPATPDDISRVTQLMYLAAKSNVEVSIYDLMFPGSMEERMEKLSKLYMATTRSFYHYSHYLVAELEGEIAGSLCGYSELEAGGLMMREALVEIGIDRSEEMAMYERMRPFFHVNPTHPEDSWIIEHVAIFPEYRGNGLVLSLLERIMAKGYELGFRYAELGMLMGNLSAQRAYEKAGFIAAEEKTDPEFERIFGSPGMVRMVKELY